MSSLYNNNTKSSWMTTHLGAIVYQITNLKMTLLERKFKPLKPK